MKSSSSQSSPSSSSSSSSWLYMMILPVLVLVLSSSSSSTSSTSSFVVVVSAFQTTQIQTQKQKQQQPLLHQRHRQRRSSSSTTSPRRAILLPTTQLQLLPTTQPHQLLMKTNINIKPNIPSSQQSQSQSSALMMSSSSSVNGESEDLSKVNGNGGDENGNESKSRSNKLQQSKFNNDVLKGKIKLGLLTFFRIIVPSILAGIIGFLVFPGLSLWLGSLFTESGVFTVLSQDSSQFVQNFLAVASLLFSILVGQTYYFMYQQQEMVYYALFDEVTEAKSLLEQVALVSQGRAMYQRVLQCMDIYIQTDLKALEKDPAILLSSRPMDDPLETIMYLTSVGVPSTIYETVKSLRQARSKRLGALQRKLPVIHMVLLWILAGLELISFPLLGAGTQSIGGYNILTIEGLLFGIMTSGIVLTLRVVGELWRQSGGAYNVDSVLKVMVRGLEKELYARTHGITIKAQQNNFPSTSSSSSSSSSSSASSSSINKNSNE